MSILNLGPNIGSIDQTQALRLELKEWEKQFAANNQGRKADRKDIKSHPDIAEKYKLYNKIRAGSAGSSGTPSSPRATKCPPPPSTQTPQKRRKQSQPLHPSFLDPYDPPISTHNTPTAHRTAIGPTPQKNGRVLGIFDLLSPAAPTPPEQTRSTLKPIYLNSLRTPSKRPLDTTQNASNNDQENTPATKRLKLSHPSALKHASFLTPSTRRILTPSHRTPHSSRAEISKLSFDDTPAFLKRDSQNAQTLRNYNGEAEGAELEYDESGLTSWSPVMKVRMRTKPAGKGLSALVRGLREMEEERLDEEMELLREMEGGSAPATKITVASALARKKNQPTDANDVFVRDSQAPDMQLGPDGDFHDSESEGDELEGMGRDGKPLRVWKKRGQKRSTRMVVMKPSRAKWKPEPKWKGGKDDDDEEEEMVPETQLVSTFPVGGGERDDLLGPDEKGDEEHPTEFEADHPSSEEEAKNTKKRKNGNKKSNQAGKRVAASASASVLAVTEEGGEKKKKKKKVAATANPNFRALKIRNKNSRAKGGKRFGRGR